MSINPQITVSTGFMGTDMNLIVFESWFEVNTRFGGLVLSEY